MYQVIVVDDEIKALDRFIRLAEKEERISSIEKFNDAGQAIEYCKKNTVEIAFLDIDMPKLSGIKLAQMLQESNPYIIIIFITAHENYALDAFRVHAFDYLLKPIGGSDLHELFDRLALRLQPNKMKASEHILYVQCFGPFLCYLNKDKSYRIHFRTAKTEELFALLLQYNGMAVPKEQIIDKLWTEVEPDKAANYFRVTCTYLRKALEEKGFPDILCRERDSYMLNTSQLNCDMFQFMSMTKQGMTAPIHYSVLDEALRLYSATYFEDKGYEWLEKYRLWLENTYKRVQQLLIEEDLRQEQLKGACDRMKLILYHDPFDEDTVIKLVATLQQLGDTTQAQVVYSKYKDNLWKELGLKPGEKLKKLVNV